MTAGPASATTPGTEPPAILLTTHVCVIRAAAAVPCMNVPTRGGRTAQTNAPALSQIGTPASMAPAEARAANTSQSARVVVIFDYRAAVRGLKRRIASSILTARK